MGKKGSIKHLQRLDSTSDSFVWGKLNQPRLPRPFRPTQPIPIGRRIGKNAFYIKWYMGLWVLKNWFSRAIPSYKKTLNFSLGKKNVIVILVVGVVVVVVVVVVVAVVVVVVVGVAVVVVFAVFLQIPNRPGVPHPAGEDHRRIARWRADVGIGLGVHPPSIV